MEAEEVRLRGQIKDQAVAEQEAEAHLREPKEAPLTEEEKQLLGEIKLRRKKLVAEHRRKKSVAGNSSKIPASSVVSAALFWMYLAAGGRSVSAAHPGTIAGALCNPVCIRIAPQQPSTHPSHTTHLQMIPHSEPAEQSGLERGQRSVVPDVPGKRAGTV